LENKTLYNLNGHPIEKVMHIRDRPIAEGGHGGGGGGGGGGCAPPTRK
jgi:hypothetical protein